MKKLALAALVVVLATGSWWLLQHSELPQDLAPADPLAPATPPASDTRSPSLAGKTPEPLRHETAPPSGEPEAPVTLPAFTVRVASISGRPVAGATVFACPDRAEVTERRTGAEGSAAFASHDGAGFVVVTAPSCMRVLRRVPLLAGELPVVVGGGGAVAGLMLVDNEPARAGLRLSLHGVPPAAAAPLPPLVAELLDSARPVSVTYTDVQGRFAFAGLDADWTGSLELPHTHRLLPQEGQEVDADQRRLLLPAPRADLVLATAQLPTLSGRVVWDDSGAPVPDPSVIALCATSDGIHMENPVIAGDEQGRFELGFAPRDRTLRTRWLDPARRTAITIVLLEVSAEDSDGETRVELDEAQVRSGAEVVVRLRHAAVTHFLVLDEQGVPLAGARVQGKALSAPTGADGRGSVIGRRDDLVVGAHGYQVVTAVPRERAAGTADDPMVFVLGRANRLVLRLRTRSGTVPAAREVVLRSTQALFGGKRWNQSALDRRFGDTYADVLLRVKSMPDGSATYDSPVSTMHADGRGQVVLHSLDPGQRCTVAVRDTLGAELLARTLVTPGPGETLEVDLVVAGEPRRIHGRVTSDDGQPLADVSVRLSGGGRSKDVTTGADGSFLFDGVYTDALLRLLATRRGFASRQREITRDAGGEAIVLPLHPGRKVTVRVVGTDGTPRSWRPSVAGDDGIHELPTETGPGEYFFVDLPPGIVTFACGSDGQTWEVKHDTAGAEVLLRVP